MMPNMQQSNLFLPIESYSASSENLSKTKRGGNRKKRPLDDEIEVASLSLLQEQLDLVNIARKENEDQEIPDSFLKGGDTIYYLSIHSLNPGKWLDDGVNR